VPQLIRMAVKKGYRLFFLGATDESNAQAAANVRAEFPDVKIAGSYSPPFRPLLEMDHAEIIRRIRAAQPDVLFVAFGCPKAEKWIAMHYRALGVPVVIGVGATIDFLAGRMKRAPVWMQDAGVEWIYRLCQEPRRLLKRYVTDLWHFSGAIVSQCWELKWRNRATSGAEPSSTVVIRPTWQRIDAGERLDVESLSHDKLWQRLPTDDRHCLLDLESVKFIDSTGVAMLVRLQKQIRAAGRHVILLSPSSAVRRALTVMRLNELFEIAEDANEARLLIETRASEKSALVLNGSSRPLVWQGEITTLNADQVWQQTWKKINSAKTTRDEWVIDLSRVRFMDSSGIGVMARAKALAPQSGVRFRFTEPSPAVRSVLGTAKLESLLDQSP